MTTRRQRWRLGRRPTRDRMRIYTIWNRHSGLCLGDYPGETPMDAYHALLAKLGYPWIGIPLSDLLIEPSSTTGQP